jgi:hypothetical protein
MSIDEVVLGTEGRDDCIKTFQEGLSASSERPTQLASPAGLGSAALTQNCSTRPGDPGNHD